MKKYIEFLYKSLLILTVLFVNIASPVTVSAANDNKKLSDLKNELKVMQNKLKENENKQDKTQAEIDKAQNDMGETKSQIDEAEKQITILSEEIIRTNDEIKEVKKQTEDLLVYYQMLTNENVYISYITGASSITDMIMKMDALELVADYNQEQVTKLELLIKTNKEKTKELEKYQIKLNDKVKEYDQIIAGLEDDIAKLIDGVPTLEDNINDLKKTIKMYEDAGCEDDEYLATCMDTVNNSKWYRPLTKGKVTSAFGMRYHPTKKKWQMHNGIDIGVAEGTKAYAPGNGIVGAVVTMDEWDKYKSSLKCGGQKIYINTYVNGTAYTVVYMHMSEVYVKVGDVVHANTVVGLTGGGKKTQKYDTCTTGAHLHYGVSKGVHYDGTSSSSKKMTANYIDPPGFPAKGSWFYSR